MAYSIITAISEGLAVVLPAISLMHCCAILQETVSSSYFRLGTGQSKQGWTKEPVGIGANPDTINIKSFS